jgi:hypothetical protein
MQYLNEILWYISWPLIIIISVKFVQLNLTHYTKMERLEELETLQEKN